MIAGCTGDGGDGGDGGADGGDGDDGDDGGVGDEDTPTPEGTPTQGGELVVANESNLTGLDPHSTASVVSWNVLYNVCETLVTFEEGALTGRLAEDWTAEGSTFTFTLRQGAMFHPPVDRELVADDVVYSFERMMSEEAQMSGDLALVDSVEATGDYEVTFELSKPFAPFMNFLPRVPWVIVPEEAVQEQGGGLGDLQEPVGTGPFVLAEHEQGDHTTVEAFEDYWGGRPPLDSVRVTPIPDADSRVLALENGDVDFARQVPGKDAQQLDGNQDLRLLETKASAWGEVYINNSQEPWDNPAVRRAVAHVVNRQAIVEAGLFGFGDAAWQPYPESSFWHVDNEEARRERDVEKAQQILDEAGNPLADTTLELKTTGAYPIMESTIEVLAENLNQAGIDAEINKLEWGTMLNDFLEGNFGAMGFSVPFKIDPDRHYYNFLHPDGAGYSHYGEDQPDAQRMGELIGEARQETDQDARKELYTELQRLINRNVPWISIAHRHNVLGMRSTVRGDPTWLLPYNRFWELSLEG